MGDEPDIVDAAVSPDGLKRWKLLRRSDGLYRYEEFTFSTETYWTGEDCNEADAEVIEYWAPTQCSGLFDDPDTAREDAFGEIPWLHGAQEDAATSASCSLA